MTTDQIATTVRQAQAQWKELCARWSELGLPGSQYFPAESLVLLLLGQHPGTLEEIVARVREGQVRLRAVRDAKVLSGFGSEAEQMGAFVLAFLDGPAEATPVAAMPVQPVPSPPVSALTSEAVREATIVAIVPCPHCNHDPERCAEGAYVLLPSPVSAPPGPVVLPAAESAPSDVLALPPVAFQATVIHSCPHCGHRVDCCKDGHYGETPLAHAAVHGIAVAGCAHVGADGKCVACTADETEECQAQDCDHRVVVAKARRCKDYGEDTDDCNRIFCDDCADECLSKYGYCDNCEIIECDGCQANVDHGTEKVCGNTQCAAGEAFCDECAPRLLTSAGLCASCAKEEVWDCDDCGTGYLESRITKCAGDKCEHSYCDDCKANNLDEGRLCADCVS